MEWMEWNVKEMLEGGVSWRASSGFRASCGAFSFSSFVRPRYHLEAISRSAMCPNSTSTTQTVLENDLLLSQSILCGIIEACFVISVDIWILKL